MKQDTHGNESGPSSPFKIPEKSEGKLMSSYRLP